MRSIASTGEPPAGHFREQVFERIDRGVPVASDRVQLEIALRDQPVAAEPGDRKLAVEFLRVHAFAVNVADAVDFAGESAFDEPRGRQPHIAGMAGKDVAHGRAVEQSLPARRHAQRRCAIEEFQHLRRGVALQHGGRHRGADDAVGAVRMKSEPHLRRAGDARRHFIAERDRADQFRAAATAFLRERYRGRHDLDARMPFSEQIAFVEFEPRAGGAVEQRCIEQAGAFAGAQHPAITRCRIGKLTRDKCLHFRLLHARRNHGNGVRDHPARARARRFADVVNLSRAGARELRKRGQIRRSEYGRTLVFSNQDGFDIAGVRLRI